MNDTPVAVRCAASATAGAALVLLWALVLHLWPSLPLDLVHSERCAGLCGLGRVFVGLMLFVPLVYLVSVLVSWPLLWLLRVRPAALIIPLGPVFGFLTAAITSRLTGGAVFEHIVPAAAS